MLCYEISLQIILLKSIAVYNSFTKNGTEILFQTSSSYSHDHCRQFALFISFGHVGIATLRKTSTEISVLKTHKVFQVCNVNRFTIIEKIRNLAVF